MKIIAIVKDNFFAVNVLIDETPTHRGICYSSGWPVVVARCIIQNNKPAPLEAGQFFYLLLS
jgi:hypothetical protein